MQLSQILKNAGSAIVRNAVPGGGLILDLIESVTGDKLDRDITADKLIEKVPPELLTKQLDIEHETLRTMLTAPQTTRPKIALGSFYIVSFSIIMTMLIWGYGVLAKEPDLVDVVVSGWPFILSLTGPLVTLLLAYFGVLRKEHDSRLGIQAPSIISKFLNK